MDGQIVVFILASVLVIAGAYYSTYFLATKTGKMRSGRSGRMIKLIDKFSLSKDKSIYLIGVKDKVYIVAMTGQNATLLEKLDITELETASVSEKAKTASTRYEPQGMVQKGLWNAFSAIKGNMPKKDKHAIYKESEKKQTGQPRQAAGEVDNLDLVYKKIQSRLSNTDMSDQEYNEENYL